MEAVKGETALDSRTHIKWFLLACYSYMTFLKLSETVVDNSSITNNIEIVQSLLKDIPNNRLPIAINFFMRLKDEKSNEPFSGFLEANQSSLDFWDNGDDEAWDSNGSIKVFDSLPNAVLNPVDLESFKMFTREELNER